MIYCAIKSCRNRTSKRNPLKPITFHTFPKDPKFADYWTRIICQTRSDPSWKPGLNTYICSAHFRKKDKYLTKSGRQKIRAGVVPSKALFEHKKVSESEDTDTSDYDIDEPLEDNIESTLITFPDNKIGIPVNVARQLEKPSTPHSEEFNKYHIVHPGIIDYDIDENIDIKPLEDIIESNINTSPNNEMNIPVDIKLEKPNTPDLEEFNKYSISDPGISRIAVEKTSDKLPEIRILDIRSIPCVSSLSSEIAMKLKFALDRKSKVLIKSRRTLRCFQNKYRRLMKRNELYLKKIKVLKEQLNSINYKTISDMLSKNSFAFELYTNLCQNFNFKNRKRRPKYSPESREFCLTLNSYSTKAYQLVREKFSNCLPHPKSLPSFKVEPIDSKPEPVESVTIKVEDVNPEEIEN